jgi:hypothetical protein
MGFPEESQNVLFLPPQYNTFAGALNWSRCVRNSCVFVHLLLETVTFA